MPEIRPGEMVAMIYQHGIQHAQKAPDAEDVNVRGWLTTTKKNTYNQIVRTAAFEFDDSLSRWDGRMLFQHGGGIFGGGVDAIPIGSWRNPPQIIDDEGVYAFGTVWKENDARILRAVREGQLTDISIGFYVMDDDWLEYDKKEDITYVNHLMMIEASIVDVGANDEAVLEVMHGMNQRAKHLNLPGYRRVLVGNELRLINAKGDFCDE